MPLLELEHVFKSYGRATQRRLALCDVSLALDAGEMVIVWGLRRSGRSTLLRVAAGIESPDEGAVRFSGENLAGRAGGMARAKIAYCRKPRASAGEQTVLDELLKDPLACGIELGPASRLITQALERAGAEQCARLRVTELGMAARARLAIARALLRLPKLLVIDEPTLGASFSERDELVGLLRSLADEGIAVLMSTDGSAAFMGADRSLMLDRGTLRAPAAPELAEVLPLRRPA